MVHFEANSMTDQARDRAVDERAAGDRQAPGCLASELVHSAHTHSHGYEVVGLSDGSKVWTDGRVEFAAGRKVDWQGSSAEYNAMVLGFR